MKRITYGELKNRIDRIKWEKRMKEWREEMEKKNKEEEEK